MSRLNDADVSIHRVSQGTVPENVSSSNQSWNIEVSVSQPVGGLIHVYETEPDWAKGIWVRHYAGIRVGELVLQSEKFLPFELYRYSWCNLDTDTKEGLRRYLCL